MPCQPLPTRRASLALGLTALLILTACGMPLPGSGAPDQVFLRPGNQIEVRYNNGIICRATYTDGQRGRFADCARDLEYLVTLRGASPVSRATNGLTEPFADIILRDGAGREYDFATPQSRRWPAGWELRDL